MVKFNFAICKIYHMIYLSTNMLVKYAKLHEIYLLYYIQQENESSSFEDHNHNSANFFWHFDISLWQVSALPQMKYICNMLPSNRGWISNTRATGGMARFFTFHIDQIYLPLTDRPSVKYVIKRTVLFFVWIQWNLW